jgi:hypothetical protein
LFTVTFLGQGHASKFDVCSSSRFFRRHSGAQVVFDVHGQVAFQLFGEFALVAFAMEHAEEPHQRAAELSKVYEAHSCLD